MSRRVVYSTTDGDLRKAPDRAERERLRGDGKVRVRREVGGRRGKTVTTIAGVPLRDAELKALAGRLKKRCVVGGAVKNGGREFQGDRRDGVVEGRRAGGFAVVRAGGWRLSR